MKMRCSGLALLCESPLVRSHEIRHEIYVKRFPHSYFMTAAGFLKKGLQDARFKIPVLSIFLSHGKLDAFMLSAPFALRLCSPLQR